MVQEDDAEGVRVLMSAQQLAAVLEQGAINLSGQGGHTLREHVGHTETQLRERLLQEPRLRASSSFPDIRTAELAISRVLHAHRRQVKTWEAGFGPIRLPLEKTMARSVGKVVVRKTGKSHDAHAVTVVLVRDEYNGMPHFVLTAYPIIPTHEKTPISRFMAAARRLF